MKHLNFFSKRQTCSHNVVTLAATVGSPSAHRRGTMLKPLFLAMLFLFVGIGNVWGAKDDIIYKINTASTKIGNSTTYQNYGPTNCSSAQSGSTISSASWCVTCGSAQTAGLWLGANSDKKSRMTLSYGNFTEASGIAAAIGGSVTTSSTYYAAMICRTNFEKVYKVTLTYTTPGGTAPSEAWILYSTDNGSTWSVAKKVTSLSTSGTDFVFDETITAAARYAFVIHSTGYCQFKVPVLTFYEGSTSTSYAVSYADAGGEGTNGSYSASSTSATAGTTVTLTADPDDCYQLNAWDVYKTGTPATKVSVTNNQFTMPAYAVTVGASFSAKGAGKTVNFNAGPGACATSSLQETCDGAGVMLPNVTATGICKGWTTFAGWATAAVTDSTTTSGVTLYAAGDNFIPSSDGQTLYAVYSKSKGGNGFKLSLTSGNTEYYVGSKGSGDYLSAVTNASNAVVFQYEDGYLSFDNSGTKTYISSGGNNTTLTVGTSKPSSTWTESGTTSVSYQSSATGQRYLAFNSSASPVRFAPYGSTYAHAFTKHSAATTYYASDPNCCTELGQINGSFF